MEVSTVIDVGCARYGGDFSVERLLEEFQPKTLIGLDPSPDVANVCEFVGDTLVMTFRAAAWTSFEAVVYHGGGLGGYVDLEPPGEWVHGFDLARLVKAFSPVVLKMDAEGAEFVLLPHLIEQGADEHIALAWIEWHPAKGTAKARRQIEKALRCEVTEWRW